MCSDQTADRKTSAKNSIWFDPSYSISPVKSSFCFKKTPNMAGFA